MSRIHGDDLPLLIGDNAIGAPPRMNRQVRVARCKMHARRIILGHGTAVGNIVANRLDDPMELVPFFLRAHTNLVAGVSA